jgi:hypothetical protein
MRSARLLFSIAEFKNIGLRIFNFFQTNLDHFNWLICINKRQCCDFLKYLWHGWNELSRATRPDRLLTYCYCRSNVLTSDKFHIYNIIIMVTRLSRCRWMVLDLASAFQCACDHARIVCWLQPSCLWALCRMAWDTHRSTKNACYLWERVVRLFYEIFMCCDCVTGLILMILNYAQHGAQKHV